MHINFSRNAWSKHTTSCNTQAENEGKQVLQEAVRVEWLRMGGQGLLRTRELTSQFDRKRTVYWQFYPFLKTQFHWLGWVTDTFIGSSMQIGLKVGQGQRPPFYTQQRDTTKHLEHNRRPKDANLLPTEYL